MRPPLDEREKAIGGTGLRIDTKKIFQTLAGNLSGRI
jgi:hypothetical protein